MIKLKFVDFWSGFPVNDNYFTNLLRKEWEIEISDTPDYIICSVFGDSVNGAPHGINYKNYNCTRILFTGENTRPDFENYQYNFGFDYNDDPRYYRLPLYVMYGDPSELLIKPPFERISAERTKFCSFVVGNPTPTERLNFFDKLSRYKFIESGGPVRNNIGKIDNGKLVIGGRVLPDKKVEWCRQYKFALCFENASYPGYTTEKLFHAMQSNAIPIYWGNPLVAQDFNPASFVDAGKFENYDLAIEHIKNIDNNDSLYREIYEQPYYPNNQLTEYAKSENILNSFRKIFNANN